MSPPRSVVLDCHHISVIDYTVISELRDLLRQFKLREVRLVFSGVQVRPLSPYSFLQSHKGTPGNYLLFLFVLVFPLFQPSVLKVLFAADLQGLRYTDSVDEALQMESENILDD